MHRITLREISALTHDTYRLVFTRPEGYDFTPGQATDFALDQDGWREETRPFTFTSQPDEPILEFTIKSYPDHDGVTKRIADLRPGDTVLIDQPWGAIQDQGPGIFIAGGAGITPFIPILRRRARDNKLSGCTLIFSNKSERDIILREEWEGMPGLECIFTVTEENGSNVPRQEITADFLKANVPDWGAHVYICGPPPMIEVVEKAVKSLGVPDEHIVTEEA
ncbi:MAG: FAD-binding oxidoreductase [Salinarimonas sp.]